MPTCAVPKCSNSSDKKFKMCHFPLKDPKRCSIWVKNINRPHWTPTKHSTLCQVHFAPEAWEKVRDDGTIKLKKNAIPTVFLECNKNIHHLSNIDNTDTIIDNDTNILSHNDTDNSDQPAILEDEQQFVNDMKNSIKNREVDNIKYQQDMKRLLDRCELLEKAYSTITKILGNAKLKIKRLERKNMCSRCSSLCDKKKLNED